MSKTTSSHGSHDTAGIQSLGFWLYLMSDMVLFASLFATYIVLRRNDLGGFSAGDFHLPFILVETLVLLTSSFTCGLMMLSAQARQRGATIAWLIVTMILGAVFLGMELYEFGVLVSEGNDWRASAFLSAYFTLVGTHGAHIAVGLLWALVMVVRLLRSPRLSDRSSRQLSLFSLFWHFLDIIWICIFTFVYLEGAL